MRDYYYEVISHPEHYFAFESKAAALGFSECNCPSFSRLENERRSQFESAVVAHIVEIAQKEVPIRLMILGCGELLDTWVLIGKLMQKGFRKMELYLIDPTINTTTVHRLKRFYMQFPDIELKCWGVHSIHHLDTSLHFHAICAIDFDEIENPGSMNDLIESSQYLSDMGKLFFDYANSDLVCSHQGLKEILHTDNGLIMEDLATIIPQNSDRLCIFAHRQTLDVLICMLTVLKEKAIGELDIYYDSQLHDIELHREFLEICYPKFHPIKLMEDRPPNLTPDLVISCFENQLYGEIWSKRGEIEGVDTATLTSKSHRLYHTVTNFLVSRENTQILRL